MSLRFASAHLTVPSCCCVWGLGFPAGSSPCVGFNCSLFAYGQTGAGKSYSMMGYGEDKGIIPIACERIFENIDNNTDPNLTIKVGALCKGWRCCKCV